MLETSSPTKNVSLDCPLSETCNLLSLVDAVTVEWFGKGPFIGDALLDLRTALAHLAQDPEESVGAFLAVRSALEKVSYFSAYQIRRRLERLLVVVVEGPKGLTEFPLTLSWRSVALLKQAAKRDRFEKGLEDWSALQVRFQRRSR
ncbi:MAG: hypothetical protein AAF555_04945 [Verrucomicrobiota bacterium]